MTSLRPLGYESTRRLKTWQTTVDKLRREKARLSQIQGLAGARITVDGLSGFDPRHEVVVLGAESLHALELLMGGTSPELTTY